jgi:REP element-mobilizing transposase RayT
MFGNITTGRMVLNDAGQLAEGCWMAIPDHFPQVKLDAFVIMPNHVHGIVVIHDRWGTACRAPTYRAPTVEQFGRPVAGSIPTIIRSFKSAATKRINEIHNVPGVKLWQRNFYEHIIRNDNELDRIRQYIANNPLQWEMDRENPDGARYGVPCSNPYPNGNSHE